MVNEKVREIKMSSWQSKVCQRFINMIMTYEDNNGVKIFEKFKSRIYYNAKKSIPSSKYPAMFVFFDGGNREPFGIRRQDWWMSNLKVIIYTLDHSENDMDDHYKWTEGIERVCRLNPRWVLEGDEDLSIHKGDLESFSYDFAFGDNFVISETDHTIGLRLKLCPANQIS